MSGFHAKAVLNSPEMRAVLAERLPDLPRQSPVTFAIVALAAAKYANVKLPETGQDYAEQQALDGLETALREESGVGAAQQAQIYRSIIDTVDKVLAQHLGRGVD